MAAFFAAPWVEVVLFGKSFLLWCDRLAGIAAAFVAVIDCLCGGTPAFRATARFFL